MKKVLFILKFASFSIITFGQSPSVLSDLFYKLNLNAPRKEIYDRLITDKRFLQTGHIETDSLSPMLHGWYFGSCLDQGLAETKADSVEVNLNYGLIQTSRKKNGTYNTIQQIIFFSTYYYSSKDSAEKEYNHIISLLPKKNIEPPPLYPFEFVTSGFIKGAKYNFRKPDTQVYIRLDYYTPVHSELRLIYVRNE